MTIREKIKKYAADHRSVRIARAIPGTNRFSGYLLACSRELILLNFVDDFHLDGFQAIRRSDVSEIKAEPSYERILKRERVLPDVEGVDGIDISDWRSLFGSLKRTGRNVIVEGEDPELDEFRIGRIVRVNLKTVLLRHFDADCKWDKRPTVIPFGDVTSVSWDSEYVTVFSKYLKLL